MIILKRKKGFFGLIGRLKLSINGQKAKNYVFIEDELHLDVQPGDSLRITNLGSHSNTIVVAQNQLFYTIEASVWANLIFPALFLLLFTLTLITENAWLFRSLIVITLLGVLLTVTNVTPPYLIKVAKNQETV